MDMIRTALMVRSCFKPALKIPGYLLATLLLLITIGGCKGDPASENKVIAYVSVDQHHAEPILKAFEAKTGITVEAVYDVEAAKTTGLVNRLIAEKKRPLADVFWSGEFVQTILLKEENVLSVYEPETAADLPGEFSDLSHYWTGFGGRARVSNTRHTSTYLQGRI